jgi:tetratricopeptide (TPR) repeat protein
MMVVPMTWRASILGLLLLLPLMASAQSPPCPSSRDGQEADCLYEQGIDAIEKGHDLGLGQNLLRQALAIRENLSPEPNTPAQAQQFLALADIYHALGRNGKAEPMYRHALSILKESVGYDHLDNVKVIDHLALILMDMGRFIEAEQGLKHSVAIIEKALGPDDSALIGPLDKLSWICDAQHRGSEAVSYRKRIEAIRAKTP